MASILDASATKPAILILHECSWASLTYAFHAKVPTSSTTYTGGHPSQLHLISNQPTSSSKNVRGHLSHMSPTPSSPISCFANARGHLTDATHAILAKLRPPECALAPILDASHTKPAILILHEHAWASLVNASHSEAASLIFHECACASDACPTLPISSSTNVRGHVQQVHSIPTPSKFILHDCARVSFTDAPTPSPPTSSNTVHQVRMGTYASHTNSIEILNLATSRASFTDANTPSPLTLSFTNTYWHLSQELPRQRAKNPLKYTWTSLTFASHANV
eukprot:CAMPEP_0114256610 /NCGR_PEP_ID=MMETSP0058-20121206/18261_1 /TAXON_ID=36894 /ORGANISM="Pyramimonas parkeae, CCMP726" /LENGTH=279 /DNA_ID=CAMNT_0001371221 /DNA_START=1778 /DNA_END=2619 /DNA_ORIENTATION=+